MSAIEIGDPPTITTQGAPALAIADLVARYSPDKPAALDGVSVRVHAGEFVAVLGANGSGKSTLLRCAVGLVHPNAGSVRLLGRDLSTLKGRPLRDARLDMALVFQDGRLVRRRTALANVASGALGRHHSPLCTVGRLPREELEYAYETLDRVGLSAATRQRADTLSGGQAQRVAIARALAQRPSVLLADEPVASLDPDAAVEVLQLLKKLAGENSLAVLCVLHQPELAIRFADRIVGIARGKSVFDQPSVDVTNAQVKALYKDDSR
jgi:phosphonate transport system ATP-binding protein